MVFANNLIRKIIFTQNPWKSCLKSVMESILPIKNIQLLNSERLKPVSAWFPINSADGRLDLSPHRSHSVTIAWLLGPTCVCVCVTGMWFLRRNKYKLLSLSCCQLAQPFMLCQRLEVKTVCFADVWTCRVWTIQSCVYVCARVCSPSCSPLFLWVVFFPAAPALIACGPKSHRHTYMHTHTAHTHTWIYMKFVHHKWGVIFDLVTLAIPSLLSCPSSRSPKPPLLLSLPMFSEMHSPPLYTNLSLTRTRKVAFVSVMKQRQCWNTGNMVKWRKSSSLVVSGYFQYFSIQYLFLTRHSLKLHFYVAFILTHTTLSDSHKASVHSFMPHMLL